jgi:hypothetical protein
MRYYYARAAAEITCAKRARCTGSEKLVRDLARALKERGMLAMPPARVDRAGCALECVSIVGCAQHLKYFLFTRTLMSSARGMARMSAQLKAPAFRSVLIKLRAWIFSGWRAI